MMSLELFILLSSAFVTSHGISSTNGSKKVTCKAPVLKNGSHVSEKTVFQVGEWLQYQCDEGYMTPQRNIVEKVQCLSTGWSAVPKCSGITCSFQPTTGSDQVHLVYTDGPVAKFSCNQGFILNGSEFSQCYYYGWDPPLPTCQASNERAKCPPPPQPENIKVIKQKSEYFSGDKETINCTPGFKLYGTQFVTCKNGQWTSPPQCFNFDSCHLSMDKVEQNNLVLPKTASFHKAYNNGAYIFSRCKTNYYRASPTLNVECLNGEMIYPKCSREKPCRINQEKLDENFLEFHPNYEAKVFYEDGESIHFVCKARFTTITDTTGLCIKEDIFYPVCHEIQSTKAGEKKLS
ncbi:coagulation factor XIII B chain-like [Anomaloglossus baeobatrachus]|uniref:coagulation factor XIII B chain-like n=1 Tax=Anomaloglossus baeobatrachus TaxID=238106 RepID=UPI003F50C3CB